MYIYNYYILLLLRSRKFQATQRTLSDVSINSMTQPTLEAFGIRLGLNDFTLVLMSNNLAFMSTSTFIFIARFEGMYITWQGVITRLGLL